MLSSLELGNAVVLEELVVLNAIQESINWFDWIRQFFNLNCLAKYELIGLVVG